MTPNNANALPDSGDRREFGTGAHRDMAGKGRCDLLPWGVLFDSNGPEYAFCAAMEVATYVRNVGAMQAALERFINLAYNGSFTAAYLDVAYHYEAGAKKYSGRNWQLGIPLDSFLDSAGRHFLKWLRGDDDERHDRAVVWNLLGALWTSKYKPEMIDEPIDGKEATK